MYALLSVEPSMPSLRAVGCPRLEVSLGTWRPRPVVLIFCDTEQEVISDQKRTVQKWFRGPRPKRDLDTSTHRPPTSKALKLGSEDTQLSGAYALQVW